ncbi:Polymer-forming protein [Lachnospiraceae bacterium KH1T2]|nr:Polymer-forming protein [Lachnospiraceae bacterium KH1T2]
MGFFSDFKDDIESTVHESAMADEVLEAENAEVDELGAEAEELPLDDLVLTDEAEAELLEDAANNTEDVLEDMELTEEIPSDLFENVSEGTVEETEEKIPEETIESVEEQGNNIFEESNNMESGVNEFENGAFDDGPVSDETGSITAGMTINGNISADGSLDVLGKVIGDINIKGKLNISGTITGNSTAAEIFADSAKITGEVISKGAVKVGQDSVILGNITATSAVIAGAVKGNIDVQGPVILDTSAIVMGDIVSKSVQINNGAVIEGHCSQSYADVNPTSFFDELKGNIDTKKKK